MSKKELQWPVRGLEHISLRPGSVVVLAAPRRTGKTTFATELALFWAQRGYRVVLAPGETDFVRQLAPLRYPPAVAEAAAWNLLVYDALRVDIGALSKAAATIGADAVVIDELQFLRYNKSRDTIAEMARRLGCVVVATCGRNEMIDTIIDATNHVRVEGMPKVRMGVQ